MLITEFDEKAWEEAVREDGREEGREEAIRKLAAHFRKENPNLTEAQAIQSAEAVLK